MALNIFKYSRIRYDQLYEDAKEYLTSTFLQAGSVFTPASAYGQLLTVMIDLGKLIFYYVEDSITELNINTATRDTSIRSLARIAGHNPTRAIAATGTVRITYNGNPIKMYGDTLIIPNYTKLVDENTGLTYTVVLDSEDIRMKVSGTSSIEVKVVQGVIEAQSVTGDGTDLQAYSINPKKGAQMDHYFYKVYVNNIPWKIYDSVYDLPYDSEGVVVKTGIANGMDLYFGNTYFGKVPELGSTIRVEYLTTSGNGGNILEGEVAQFKFNDDLFDTAGNTVKADEGLGIAIGKPIIFGADVEPIFLTRILAPKTSRSYVLANADSYVYFLEKFNIFSVIDAFTTIDDGDIEDDNIVYLFLIPDVNKRKPVSDDYFTVPIELFLLSNNEKEKIYDLVEESGQKILNTELKIIDPIVKKYVVNINVVAYEGYNKDAIRQEIISKCSDYFLKNRRRDRIPKSDLIGIIESVSGVDSVNLWFVSEENEFFKSNPENASQDDIGIDAFGDIIINRGEYALIRGGWADRNGYVYSDTKGQDKPGSINIAFGRDTRKSLNMELHRIGIENIKG